MNTEGACWKLHYAWSICLNQCPVKNLGVVFYHGMKMTNHITQLCHSLNWHIRNLRRIRKFLDSNACHNVVRALILSKLDYCCRLLNSVSKKDICHLQRLQNRCARLVFQRPKHTHISPLLKQLHWLPVAPTYSVLPIGSRLQITETLCTRLSHNQELFILPSFFWWWNPL